MKSVTVILSVAILFLLSSCLKPDHFVRITNNNYDPIINVMVGPASFGEVDPLRTTDYMHIPEGTSTISGVDKNNSSIVLTGNVSVTGDGKHRWTVTINQNGTLSIQRDK